MLVSCSEYSLSLKKGGICLSETPVLVQGISSLSALWDVQILYNTYNCLLWPATQNYKQFFNLEEVGYMSPKRLFSFKGYLYYQRCETLKFSIIQLFVLPCDPKLQTVQYDWHSVPAIPGKILLFFLSCLFKCLVYLLILLPDRTIERCSIFSVIRARPSTGG
jgi:hypothetical protein